MKDEAVTNSSAEREQEEYRFTTLVPQVFDHALVVYVTPSYINLKYKLKPPQAFIEALRKSAEMDSGKSVTESLAVSLAIDFERQAIELKPLEDQRGIGFKMFRVTPNILRLVLPMQIKKSRKLLPIGKYLPVEGHPDVYKLAQTEDKWPKAVVTESAAASQITVGSKVRWRARKGTRHVQLAKYGHQPGFQAVFESTATSYSAEGVVRALRVSSSGIKCQVQVTSQRWLDLHPGKKGHISLNISKLSLVKE